MPEMTEQITALARRRGRLSSTDLAEIGASRTTLAYLAKKGVLRRIARGVYVPADQISENETLQAVSLAVPHLPPCQLRQETPQGQHPRRTTRLGGRSCQALLWRRDAF